MQFVISKIIARKLLLPSASLHRSLLRDELSIFTGNFCCWLFPFRYEVNVGITPHISIQEIINSLWIKDHYNHEFYKKMGDSSWKYFLKSKLAALTHIYENFFTCKGIKLKYSNSKVSNGVFIFLSNLQIF